MEQQQHPGNVNALIRNVQKCFKKNETLRIEHSGNPLKFVDSECALDDSIKLLNESLTRNSTSPQATTSALMELLTSLLTHENIDIISSAVCLWSSFIKQQQHLQNIESHSEFYVLLVSLLANDKYYDTNNFAIKIYSSLEILIESLENKEILFDLIMQKTTWFQYVMDKMSSSSKNSMSSYQSELLSTIMAESSSQHRNYALEKFNYHNLEKLLQGIHKYLNDEIVLENLCQVCVTVVTADVTINQESFRKLEGFELVLRRVLKKKTLTNIGLCIIEAVTNNNVKSTARLVTAGGLKSIFKYVMKQNNTVVLGILRNLCLYISPDTDNDTRLYLKFVEKDFEKLDRLVELFQTHLATLSSAEEMLRQKTAEIQEELNTERDIADWEEVGYEKRIENGLEEVQNICLILSSVCVLCTGGDVKNARGYITGKFREEGLEISDVSKILKEQAERLSIEDDVAFKNRLSSLSSVLLPPSSSSSSLDKN